MDPYSYSRDMIDTFTVEQKAVMYTRLNGTLLTNSIISFVLSTTLVALLWNVASIPGNIIT